MGQTTGDGARYPVCVPAIAAVISISFVSVFPEKKKKQDKHR